MTVRHACLPPSNSAARPAASNHPVPGRLSAPRGRPCAGRFRLSMLLILVAVVLLIAVAIPAWQERTIRGRVTDVLGTAAEATLKLSEYVATQGELPVPGDPALDAVLSLATDPDGIQDATWKSDGGGVGATGVLALTLAETEELGPVSGGRILMTGTVIGGRRVSWACAPGNPEHLSYLPTACGEAIE